MSKYGMKIADETVYGIKSPDQAIELIKKLLEQYFGEFWTQFKPRCPLCNEALSDCERHQNRPVGECTNPKCDSTIHISDYLGKMKDVIAEWDVAAPSWVRKMQEHVAKKSTANSGTTTITPASGTGAGTTSASDRIDLSLVDEETVYVW